MLPLKLSNLLHRLAVPQTLKSQQLWGYVAIAFNKVDPDRLKLVGPDRLCAEWVLKNGGAVKFIQGPSSFLRDYNSLPPESTRVQIKEIDGTDSSVMKLGFDHLKSCRHIDRVVLHNCKHLEEDGLTGLPHIKDTLTHLQVSSCHNLNGNGLMALKELTKLQTLLMFDLIGVKDLNKVVSELKKHLTGCTIDTAEKS